MDTPLPGPGGYGQCAPPACNCGSKPCGFYAWNHSSDAIINGMSFQDWFVNAYVLDSIGSSPAVVRAHAWGGVRVEVAACACVPVRAWAHARFRPRATSPHPNASHLRLPVFAVGLFL